MAFNKNEMILDRVRNATAHDLEDGSLLYRLTSLEEPTLGLTAEGEEVTDAVGATITTLYRAKKATFSATNSVFSFDLAAAQFGSEKVVASSDNKIVDYTYEILTVSNGKVTLSNIPHDDIKYIYTIESNEIGTKYTVGSQANETNFSISGKEITVPTGVTSGKIFVEYNYENENAMKLTAGANDYPSQCSLVIYAYFRNVCNDSIKYSGKIICPKAKLSAESIELALNSTGKHPFTFNLNADYCDEDAELFSIIVSE